MSYLEMSAAPLPDMSKGVISIWFREATKGTLPPSEDWPSGAWVEGTPSMVPPDTAALVKTLSPSAIVYWNAYGLPLPNFAALFGPAEMYMPTPPPIVINDIHALLTFGDSNQPYNYCPWHLEFPGVIDAVYNTGSPFPGVGFRPEAWPPPYAPYFVNLGDAKGKFRVVNMKLDPVPAAKSNMVPQSFIGVDKDGYLIICLQTKTRATYKGYAFMLDKITEMWAAATILEFATVGGVSHPTNWVQISGYWNGYQFEYKDISNEIMSAQPETFVLGGPLVFTDLPGGPNVRGKGWHHLLFSFDISGPVHSEQPATPEGSNRQPDPVLTTNCKAWLAVDDQNYSGMALQRRLMIHDGFTQPLLPGMGTDLTGFGPVTSMSRSNLSLGSNDIVPQNIWLIGLKGKPRDGLLRYFSNTPIEEIGNAYVPKGDFNALLWAGNLWPLYGHGVVPGPWLPVLDPPRPTVPDPKTFDLPTYDCPSFSIPTHGHPIGIPASTHHLQHNTGVEMGELQIWANKTLDTDDTSMRRLFIDANGKAVPPKEAEKVLGKPDILLHGTGNWKQGTNTGSASANFSHIARIEKFLPDPQLNK